MLLFSIIFAIPKPAAIPEIDEIIIVRMSMFIKFIIYKKPTPAM
jgi:hypothetical protein